MNQKRLMALIRKEFIQIVRDPSAIAIAFVMPIILLFLFGYGVSLDAKHVPVALVIDHPSTATTAFTSGFDQSQYFTPKLFPSIQSAKNALEKRQEDAIIMLRDNFNRDIAYGVVAPIGVFLNGVNANNAHLLEGYFSGVWQNWIVTTAIQKGRPFISPVETQSRIWFNPALRSTDYLVPGLVAIIMTLIGALLTALVVSREWERGTMEALMATPVTMGEILLGKLIPYFILGMGGMLLSVFVAVFVFRVPLIGNFWVLLFFSALFLLAALGMGLLVSSVARNQFIASQIAIIVTFLPAFILSGFIFDINSMPTPIRWITQIIPARYFVTILQTVFLAGDIWRLLILNGLALLGMASLFFLITLLRSRKRLD